MRISLKAARVNAGYTVAEVANKIGITERTLANWEKYETYPRVDQLFPLCDLYGCDIYDLIFLRGSSRNVKSN